MKYGLLKKLCCPYCSDSFKLIPFEVSSEDVENGLLRCTCQWFPIIGGIPRIISGKFKEELFLSHRSFFDKFSDQINNTDTEKRIERNPEPSLRTMRTFGYQWNKFDEMYEYWEEEFLRYINPPITRDFFKGKFGLDAGCGMGRFACQAGKFGAEVIGVDLSNAVEAAYRNTKDNPNIHIIQADIYNLPFPPQSFDFIYSIGVLHHLPNPSLGFRTLLKLLRPAAPIFFWMYSDQKSRGWKILRKISQSLPIAFINMFSFFVALAIYVIFIVPNRIIEKVGSRSLKNKMKFKLYTNKSFRVLYTDCFDELSAPVIHYYNEEDLREWLKESNIETMMLSPTGKNGWRVYAQQTK